MTRDACLCPMNANFNPRDASEQATNASFYLINATFYPGDASEQINMLGMLIFTP